MEIKDKKILKEFLEKADKIRLSVRTWKDHIRDKDIILMYSTLALAPNDTSMLPKIFITQPKSNEIFLPHAEMVGDTEEYYILSMDMNTGKEIFRKSVRTIDMIYWNLSSI